MRWSNGDHFILYMDIMGFKERVARSKHKDLHDILWKFQTKNNKLKPLLESRNGELMRISHFSDSIIIATLDAGKASLNRLIKAAAILMCNGLECGIALRGVISKGLLTFDHEKKLYFGKPIIDAYLLEEQINLYGIIIHHTAEEAIRSILNNPPKNQNKGTIYVPIMRANIPFKNGISSHFCVAYHLINRVSCKENITNYLIPLLQALYPSVSGEPRVYVDNTIKCLRENQSI